MSGNGSPGEMDRALVRRAGASTLGVVVSRFTGLFREQVLASLFPTRVLDAFVAAFRLPNALREMLAEGALSKAFLTVFAQLEERGGRKEADRLLALTLRTLVPVVTLVVALGIVFAPQLVALVFRGGAMSAPPPGPFAGGFATMGDLAVWLTRMMFPFLFFISLAALYTGGLQARRRFFLPAVASAFFNLATIAGALLGAYLGPHLGLHPMAGLALGIPLGGLVQLGAQWRTYRRSAVRVRLSGIREFDDPGLKKVGRLFLPVALSSGSLQIHVLISSYFQSMGTSWLTWTYQGYRIAQFPSALVGVALSHAGLPELSRAAARGDRDRFLAILVRSGRLLMILGLASAAGLAAIAEPLVAAIYEHGVFRTEDTQAVATVIRVYALGLPAFGAVKILTDGFFALGTTRPPLMVTLGGIGVLWLVTDFAVEGLGYAGIPLGTAAVAWASAGALFGLLAGRLGRDGANRPRSRALASAVADAALRGLVTAGLAGVPAWLVASNVETGGALLAEVAVTGVATLAGLAGFALGARRLVPVEYALLRDALGRFVRRR